MKAAVEQIHTRFAFSERRACGLLRLAVNTFRYQATKRNADLRERLIQIARDKPRFRYRRLHVLVNRDGSAGKPQTSLACVSGSRAGNEKNEAPPVDSRRRPLTPVTAANEEWALESVSDEIQSGRHIRLLAVVDAYSRVCLALKVDTSFASRRVTGVLDRIIAEHGWAGRIRCDNGSELTSRYFLAWCLKHRIELLHIQSGRPMQKGVWKTSTAR